MATFTEIAQETRRVVDECVKSVNEAIHDGNLSAYNEKKSALDEQVKNLNTAICKVEYEKLGKEPAPIIAAVQQYYVDGFKVEEEREEETNALTCVKLADKKMRINLDKFCEVVGLDRTWVKLASELHDLLVLKKVGMYQATDAQLAKKSFYFISQNKRKAAGETPDSNTQIVAKLQACIDAAIFVDNGAGLNAYKCTNHDIMFIHDCITKKGNREKCSIDTINANKFKEVIMDVFAHCLGEAYKVRVAGAKKKNSSAPSSLSVPEKTEAAKEEASA